MGLVATYNRTLSKYWSTTQVIEPGQQVCSPKSLIIDALAHFKEVNDTYPEQVIIYRDVGAGTNLKALKTVEVAAIEAALKSVSEDIKLLYVVVTKKTQVELYA